MNIFLISERTPKPTYAAHCELHARKLAEKVRVALPIARGAGGGSGAGA